MKGNCQHKVGIRRPGDAPVESPNYLELSGPVLMLGNDEDTFYWQGFETREELETFIAALRIVADKAFG